MTPRSPVNPSPRLRMRFHARVLVLAPLCAAVAACSASSLPPAPPPSAGAVAPAGPWLFTLTRPDGTELAVRMTLEAGGAGKWRGHSRPGAAAELLPWRRAVMARVLGKLPPRAALVSIPDATASRAGDSVVVRGVLASPLLGRHHLRGSLSDGRLRGELRRDTAGAVTGTFTAVPRPGDQPVRDYSALAVSVRQTFADKLYDPALVERPEWRAFFQKLDARFARARDDVDAMAAFYALEPQLRMSHIEFFRNPRLAASPPDSILRAAPADPDALVTLTFPTPHVALLRVSRWSQVSPVVKRAFQRIDSAGARTLVLDIRSNPGGDVSSMSPAAHLLRDSTFVGVFLGRRWYAAHREPPTPEEVSRFPVLSSDSLTGLAVLQGVREHGVVPGVVPPRAPHFDGEVYLLVNRRSGSASEPLAHLLRATGRATLVGERTAGAMLSAPPHPAGQGWMLTLPEADYFTADGTRLERTGVTPHIPVASAEALAAVAERLGQRDPFARAMLLATARLEASRLDEAERWYSEALRLHPQSAAAEYGLGRVFQLREQWEPAFEHFERALRLDPGHTESLYQVGRTAAFSGQRLERGERALRQYLARPHHAGEPSHAAAHWRLGMVLQARGDADGARDHFRAALGRDPENPDYLASLRALKR